MRAISVFALSLLAAAANAAEVGHGGGPAPSPANENCVPAATEAAIRAIAEAQRSIRPTPIINVPLYFDPMGGGGINSFGKTVTNYVDLDPSTGILDWNCGGVTYDGHAGTDIEIPSFYHMDEGVPILAAAPGHVSYSHDGEFDRRTAWINGVDANAVVVAHDDGSFAYYWHMRKGSVRVGVGATVATGDTLGMVGSSGFSSGPHLHFETYQGATVDPFHGSCQAGPSYWQSQGAYVSTLPFQLFAHGLTTIALDWPTILELPPSKTHVTGGSTVYSWIRPRNLAATDVMTWRLFRNGVQQGEYSFSPGASYSSSWWYIYWTLPTGQDGNWRFDILRNGALIAQQPFTMNGNPNLLPVVYRTAHLVPMNGTLDGEVFGADPDGAIFSHEVTTPPSHGTITLYGGRQRKFRYVPTTGYTGVDGMYVRARDDEGAWGSPTWIPIGVGVSTGVDDVTPAALALAVSPNPIDAAGAASFTLPKAGHATLELYDVAGHRVRTLASGAFAAGAQRVTLDLGSGGRLPAGVYFISLATAEGRSSRRVVVAR